MALASGLGSQLGAAKETTYGTVVTPTKFFEFTSETLARNPTYQTSVGLRAGRTFAPSARVVQTTRQAGGGINMDVPTKGFGSWLDLLHGAVVAPVQQASTTAYKQTHPVGTTQPNKSLTTQVNRPDTGGNDHAFTWPGTVLTSATFACDVGGLLTFAATLDAQDETIATPLAVASYPAGIKGFNHTQGIISVGGTPLGVVQSFSLTWTQPYKDDRFFFGAGGLKGKPIPNGIATVEGTLAVEFADMTAYNYFVSGAMVAVTIDFLGDTIAGTNKDEIKFTLPATQFRGSSPNVDGPDVLALSAPIMAFDDGTDPPMSIDYMSTDITL